jgi:hypothetical protein
MVWYRRELPLIMTFVLGVLITSDYFVVFEPLQKIAVTLSDFATIVATFALGLGAASLTLLHSKKIIAKTSEWYLSVLLVGSLFIVVAVGLIFGVPSAAFQFQFRNIYGPLEATVFSLLAFFLLTTAYRALRIRTVEATVFLVSALAVVLMNAPVTEFLWGGFTTIGSWVSNVPNTAGQRGILIAAAIGAVALCVRTILGRESGYLGGKS